MNINPNIDKSCLHGDELVSYLYDEMPPARRSMFEDHLLDCGTCTDEFAELSLARLGVYEWNRDEFAAMPTPAITIPYEKKIDAATTASWIKNWLAPILSTPKWAMAGGSLVIIVALGFFLFTSNLDNDVSGIDVKPPGENPLPISTEAGGKLLTQETNPKPVIVKASGPTERDNLQRAPRPIRTAVSLPSPKRNKVDDQATAVRNVRSVNKAPALMKQTAPRLNNFDDEDDNTLRLADLFADIDTKRLR